MIVNHKAFMYFVNVHQQLKTIDGHDTVFHIVESMHHVKSFKKRLRSLYRLGMYDYQPIKEGDYHRSWPADIDTCCLKVFTNQP